MNNISIGLSYQLKEKVTNLKSARSIGSGTLDVYSTPSMIALLEKTSWKCIDAYLDKDETSVGGSVNVLHLRPTAIGKYVLCTSKVISIEENRVEFQVEIYEGDKMIGKGTHIRFIINRDSFLSSL